MFRIIRAANFAEVSVRFDLEPVEAIKFFESKGLRPSFDYRDVFGEEHDASVTVAKMMDMDLLSTVQDRLKSALDSGKSFGSFAKELIPELQAAGWWGKGDVIDPLTGKVVNAQLGSASRLETIFRTNLQTAYSVGRWDMIQRNAKTAPYLMYDAIEDDRTRASHKAHDGLVLPVSSVFWRDWMPPNGYNCRCSTVQMSQDDLNDYGLKVSKPPKIKKRSWTNPRTGKTRTVPDGIDPGFDNNPGYNRQKHLEELEDQKAGKLPPEQKVAVKKSPKPKAPEIYEPLTHESAKEKGKAILDNLLSSKMSGSDLEGMSHADALKYFEGNTRSSLIENWADSFQSNLLTQLSSARSISTPAKVEGTGKGAKAVRDASKRYPDDWTAEADKLGALYVKFSAKRGYQITLERDTPVIQDFGFSREKIKSPAWVKGTGFIVTDDSSTAAHEYAHRLQYALAELDNYFNEEHRRRTKGDPLKKLRDITRLNYRASEVTREDGYYDAYMGKEYSFAPEGRPAMEVMTMTFEPLLGNHDLANARRLYKLLTIDPDMAQLAIGLLFNYKVKPQ